MHFLFELGLEDKADDVKEALSNGDDFDTAVNNLLVNPEPASWDTTTIDY